MSFKEIKPEELQKNPFQMIGKEWLLVTAEKDGKANVAVLTMSSPVSIQKRIEGVKDALEDLDINYVSEQDYEGNREKLLISSQTSRKTLIML